MPECPGAGRWGHAGTLPAHKQVWQSLTMAVPAPAGEPTPTLHPQAHPSPHPSVLVSIYTHLFLCHQSEGLLCLGSSPHAHIYSRHCPAAASQKITPQPSFPTLKWCQTELISPKHK